MSTGNGYDDNGNPVQYGFGGGMKTCEDCIKLCKIITNVPAEYCLDFEPKEKPMTEKIQMTEEQAYEMCKILSGSGAWEADLIALKKHGYIRKSELETLVEEAEENYHDPTFEWQESANKLFEAIQALKKDHPQFGG